MTKNMESKSLDQLMAEADELMLQINTDAAKDMEESHRLEFEKHAQRFNKIKSAVQGKVEKTESEQVTSSADGMHEAMQDIMKAFQNLKNKLF
jgi:uncharacterized protein YoxC